MLNRETRTCSHLYKMYPPRFLFPYPTTFAFTAYHLVLQWPRTVTIAIVSSTPDTNANHYHHRRLKTPRLDSTVSSSTVQALADYLSSPLSFSSSLVYRYYRWYLDPTHSLTKLYPEGWIISHDADTFNASRHYYRTRRCSILSAYLGN